MCPQRDKKRGCPNLSDSLQFIVALLGAGLLVCQSDYFLAAKSNSNILVALCAMMVPGPKIAAAPALYKKS